MSEDGRSQLAASLLCAQSEFPVVKKTKTARMGEKYSYTYADLAEILHAVIPILGKHGIAVTQRYSVQEGTILLETMLLHTSGELLSSMLPISGPGPSAQEIGSLCTYMRRYALTALLGIAAEDDDDGKAGNEATPVKAVPKPAPKREKAPPPSIEYEAWADEKLGIGKTSKTTFVIDGVEKALRDITWREMASGSKSGHRHKFLVDTLEWCQQQDQPGRILQQFMERAPAVIDRIETGGKGDEVPFV